MIIIPTKHASTSTVSIIAEFGPVFKFLDYITGFFIVTGGKICNLHFAIPVEEVVIK